MCHVATSKEATMSDVHTVVSDYAEDLISVPRSHLVLEMTQDDAGIKLKHLGKTLVECYLTPEGMATSNYIAKALGIHIPPLGDSAHARVSTGVLFRAVSIASLDFKNNQTFFLLERLLEEAEMQRGGSSDLT